MKLAALIFALIAVPVTAMVANKTKTDDAKPQAQLAPAPAAQPVERQGPTFPSFGIEYWPQGWPTPNLVGPPITLRFFGVVGSPLEKGKIVHFRWADTGAYVYPVFSASVGDQGTFDASGTVGPGNSGRQIIATVIDGPGAMRSRIATVP